MRRTGSGTNFPLVHPKTIHEMEIENNRNRINDIHREMADIYEEQKDMKHRLNRMEEMDMENMEFQQLSQLKKERKKLENNVQLLNNRIELLKKEEQRFWKKIRELHHVANQMEELKKMNQKRKREKEQVKTKLDLMSKTRGNFGVQKREEKETNMEKLKEVMEWKKRMRVEEIQQERKRNEKIYNKTKATQQMNNRMKKMAIIRQESDAILHKRIYEEQKKKLVKDRLHRYVSNEKFIIKKFKRELDSLGRTEADLIGKLRTSQQVESMAFDKLKKVLDIKEEEDANMPRETESNKLDQDGQENKFKKSEIDDSRSGKESSDKDLSIE